MILFQAYTMVVYNLFSTVFKKQGRIIKVFHRFQYFSRLIKNRFNWFNMGEKNSNNIVFDDKNPFWENPEVFNIGQIEPHANFIPYSSVKEFFSSDRFQKSNSKCVKSLNGKWKFHWVKKPSDRPKHFYENTCVFFVIYRNQCR